MNEIQGIARLKIHDGKLEEFKRVAVSMHASGSNERYRNATV